MKLQYYTDKQSIGLLVQVSEMGLSHRFFSNNRNQPYLAIERGYKTTYKYCSGYAGLKHWNRCLSNHPK